MKNSRLLGNIANFEEKTAIIYQDNEYTYRDLEKEVDSMVEFLKDNGIERGEVVAILSDYSFKSISLFLSLMQNKNIIVPIISKVENEINERLYESHADKKIILNENKIESLNIKDNREKHKLIKELQKKASSGLILFSSGSTGKPKAMIHDLDELVKNYEGKRPKKHRILVFLMFDHIGGLNTLFNALSIGSSIIIPEGRDASYICELIEKHKINILPTSPTFLNLVLISEAHKKYDLSSLIMITYGTEPMPGSLLKRLKSAFPRTRFLQTFGTSETGIARTSSKSSTSTLLKIDDPNTEYKIVNGELWLRSKTQILGYINYPSDEITEDGWFKTGDLVDETEDGYLRIKGRINEEIIVGGQKVLPSEVESVLFDMPQIADCLIYGEKNVITGQIVAANLVLKEGADPKETKKAVLRFCKNKLDDYKIPIKINIVDKTNFGDRFKKIRRKA